MLGASLSLFAFVGTLVSFGAWPGLSSHENVDSLLVESVTTRTSEPIQVDERARRVSGAERVPQAAQGPVAGTRQAVPVARVPGTPAPTPAAQAPAPSTDGGNAPAQQPVAQVPTRPLERTTNELGRTVDTVTQQTGELVNEVGQQVQEPLKTVGGPVNGLTGR